VGNIFEAQKKLAKAQKELVEVKRRFRESIDGFITDRDCCLNPGIYMVDLAGFYDTMEAGALDELFNVYV